MAAAAILNFMLELGSRRIIISNIIKNVHAKNGAPIINMKYRGFFWIKKTHYRPRNIFPERSICTIEPKYADDITYASTSQHFINNIEETVPAKLKKYNLGVSHTKTEKYTAPLESL